MGIWLIRAYSGVLELDGLQRISLKCDEADWRVLQERWRDAIWHDAILSHAVGVLRLGTPGVTSLTWEIRSTLSRLALASEGGREASLLLSKFNSDALQADKSSGRALTRRNGEDDVAQ
jgi:hypothetical protein